MFNWIIATPENFVIFIVVACIVAGYLGER